jgi:hypothetical protein
MMNDEFRSMRKQLLIASIAPWYLTGETEKNMFHNRQCLYHDLNPRPDYEIGILTPHNIHCDMCYTNMHNEGF